jgi:hypothetical protein
MIIAFMQAIKTAPAATSFPIIALNLLFLVTRSTTTSIDVFNASVTITDVIVKSRITHSTELNFKYPANKIATTAHTE